MIDGVTMIAKGPIFDGRAQAALLDGIPDATEDVAQAAFDTVQANMSASFRNPTGAYSSRVRVDRQTSERLLVHDDNVVYGPWLESGQYTPPRRFRGYAHWRRTTQQIDAKATSLFEQTFDKYVGRMR